MTVASVYKQGWTMDDIHWSLFDPSKVTPKLLSAVKAAALVEYNAPDYVAYLKRVFAGSEPSTIDSIEQWGREEAQHGRALGRWAEMADPSFKLEEAIARFRKGHTPAHFARRRLVRGSRGAVMPLRAERDLLLFRHPDATESRCCRRLPAASPPMSTAITSCSTTRCMPSPSRI